MMLIRSGLSILVDHPRLYFNNDCTPGSEWIRFTPIHVPTDRVWTAKDDARYISPIVATPGYRHTVGVARSWHFLDVYGFVLTGMFFVILLFCTEQWRRLVPQSTVLVLQAWNTWVHYATFHMPPEFNGYFGYNALQQIAYFCVVFVFGPLAILTGTAMSPAAVNRFPWYPKLFGGRQSARSIHFLTMLGFFAFIVVHVTLIVMTGFVRNMNHIVMGTDDQNRLGMILGFAGIAVVFLFWIGAHYVSWFYPRFLQHAQKFITYPLLLATLNRLAPSQHYTEQDISPRFWPNGKMPVREDWKQLAERVPGISSRRWAASSTTRSSFLLPISRNWAKPEHITMHHCIQGWRGIAKWGGLPMKILIDLVRPKTGECQGGCLLLVWRVALRGPILRHAEHGERAQSGVPACFADEWEALPRGIWRAIAAARRKSAWLQDGQVD